MFGGQVGIAGHLHIADKVQIASQSGIAKDVTEPGGYMGSPIMSGIKFHRANAVFHKLPELSAQVRQLEKKSSSCRPYRLPKSSFRASDGWRP